MAAASPPGGVLSLRIGGFTGEQAMTNQTEAARVITNPVYPAGLYPYLLLFALADVFLTSRIIALGGVEVNVLANHVLTLAGVLGLLTLKLASVLVVFLACDFIATRGDRRAIQLAQAGIALNILPVAIGGAQLAMFFIPNL